METNQFALYKGKIVYVPDVPEELKDGQFYGEPLRRYKDAIKSAIANGIEVENYGTVIMYAGREDKFFERQGQLHSLQCRVEKRNYCASDICDTDGQCERCREPKVLARVTFEQPEKKMLREPDKERDKDYSPLHDYIMSSICDNLRKYAPEAFDKAWTSSLFPERLTKEILEIVDPEPEAAGQEQETYTLDDLRQAFFVGRRKPGLSFENYLEYKNQKP